MAAAFSRMSGYRSFPSRVTSNSHVKLLYQRLGLYAAVGVDSGFGVHPSRETYLYHINATKIEQKPARAPRIGFQPKFCLCHRRHVQQRIIVRGFLHRFKTAFLTGKFSFSRFRNVRVAGKHGSPQPPTARPITFRAAASARRLSHRFHKPMPRLSPPGVAYQPFTEPMVMPETKYF